MRLLVLSDDPAGTQGIVSVLELLGHTVASAALSADGTPGAAQNDVVIVDATGDLAQASSACRTLASLEAPAPVVVLAPERALATLKPSWGFDDWVLPSAQPAEVETRLRLAMERSGESRPGRTANVGDLSIDEDTYVVRLRGRPLDLTYREFELLKHLASHPGLVFTRAQLLKEVWGYDFFGGTRTVDVHIRRLRAKLGAEHEQLIGTVRGVGYKLDPTSAQAARALRDGVDQDPREAGQRRQEDGTVSS